MEETKNNKSCCKSIDTDPSCSCSSDTCDCGKPVERKSLKTVICLLVLLAAGSIIAFKIMNANSSVASNEAAAFDFGQAVIKTTLTEDNMVQANQRIGEYVKSLNELNTVAVNDDAVFVFIPGSGNAPVDDTTITAVFSAQQSLKRADISAGLYTLSDDSTDYSEIAKRVELPVILVARKGSGAIITPGSNVDEIALLQAYLACCDTGSSCCP